jgi:hypothetical protein
MMVSMKQSTYSDLIYEDNYNEWNHGLPAPRILWRLGYLDPMILHVQNELVRLEEIEDLSPCWSLFCVKISVLKAGK